MKFLTSIAGILRTRVHTENILTICLLINENYSYQTEAILDKQSSFSTGHFKK